MHAYLSVLPSYTPWYTYIIYNTLVQYKIKGPTISITPHSEQLTYQNIDKLWGGGNTPLIASNMYTLCSPSNLTLIISDNETGTSHLRTADQPTYRKHKGQFQNPRNLLFFQRKGKQYISQYISHAADKRGSKAIISKSLPRDYTIPS